MRVVEVLERDGRGLNLTAEVRDGILPPHRVRAARHARGRDRPPGRPLRLREPRHRRRRPRGHPRRRRPPGGAARACSAPRSSARVDALVHDLVETSDRAGAIEQSPDYAAALSELRRFMFEHVYLGPPARAENARAAAVVEDLFRHHLAGSDPVAATDWVAGMTDRYALRAHSGARLRRVSTITRESLEALRGRGRHGRPGRRPHAASPLGRPVRRAGARSTTSARRRSRSTRSRRSTTASAASGAATTSRSCARPRTSTSPRRSRRWPTATASGSSTSSRRRPTSAAGPSAAGSCASWTMRPASTPGTCGSRPRRRPPVTYLAERGITEATASDYRLGFSPSAWDRVCAAALAKGFTAAELGQAGLSGRGRRGPGRPVPRPPDVPAGRRPRAGARLRRPPDARRRAAQVPELAGRPALPQERGAVRARPRPRARSPRPGRPSSSRATPTSSPSTRPARRTRWRRWGRPLPTAR